MKIAKNKAANNRVDAPVIQTAHRLRSKLQSGTYCSEALQIRLFVT